MTGIRVKCKLHFPDKTVLDMIAFIDTGCTQVYINKDIVHSRFLTKLDNP